MAKTDIDDQAELAGIFPDYRDMHGQTEVISQQTKQKLLSAMSGIQPINCPLLPVYVFTQGQSFTVSLQQAGYYHWTLELEDSGQFSGINGGYPQFYLPNPLPAGYHQLILRTHQHEWHSSVIIAPAQCYQPPALINHQKLWGICLQLYTLRSRNNWGIGDFSDLKSVIQQIAQRGGAFVGVNPIHSLYPANPQAASPYSPSSRNWLNIIYIDVAAIEDFQASPAAQSWWHDAETQRRLHALRDTKWVDHAQVMALKLEGLRLAYQHFITLPADAPRVVALNQFVAQAGLALQQQAVFDAVHEEMRMVDGWRSWPAPYQDFASKNITEFQTTHQDKISFYCWLQWLAQGQLADCYAVCQQHAMPVGLYRDLAVGVSEGGSDTWSDKQLYRLNASIGAPPDALGPLGQNWGLPPQDPNILKTRAYQPFIDLLRANMRFSGALRIDHVMGLHRLWWVPYGETADQGAYVRYPDEDLFAILALESQRHQCMVIGEDLGLVPQQVATQLHQRGIYSYKVLYFEQTEFNQFKAPEMYPVQAMTTITTHDLPTLAGYWQSEDLIMGKQIGLYPDDDVLQQQIAMRSRNKHELVRRLVQYGCLSQKLTDEEFDGAMTLELNQAIHHYVAITHSGLLGLQLEDWLNMTSPVNIPGTTEAYPNWRRKLSQPIEAIFADAQINQLVDHIQQYRRYPLLDNSEN